jgi:hypothetical protein
MLTKDTDVILLNEGEHEKIKITRLLDMITSEDKIIVESYDKRPEQGVVSSVRTSDCKDFIYIKCDTGDTLVLTHDHKIYIPEDRAWMRADAVVCGKKLLSSDGSMATITSAHTISDTTPSRVFSLAVTPTQCYFANNILVHNES